MKRVLIPLFLLFAMPSMAQHMLVDKVGDNPPIIDFTEFSNITFNGTTVNILLNDGTASSSDMSEIKRIEFGDFTAIDGTVAEKGVLVSYVSSDEIAINCKAGTTVTIYNVIGTQMLCTRLDAQGGRISIAGLPQGIYIVKADDRTAKIVKR